MNVIQLWSIYLFTLVLSFIIFKIIKSDCQNLLLSSLLAAFVLAICLIWLEPLLNDLLLSLLIIIASFLPIVAVIYLITIKNVKKCKG